MIPCRIVDDIDDDPQPGDIEYRTLAVAGTATVLGIAMVCPTCGKKSWLPFRTIHPATNKGWTWDGNRERPTLTPSVDHDPSGCSFHGWLRDGEWVTA